MTTPSLSPDEQKVVLSAESRLLNTTSLTELRDLLNEIDPDEYPENTLASLPTFGGDEPSDTRGIYSWDEANLLMSEDPRTGASEWTIVPRSDYEEA